MQIHTRTVPSKWLVRLIQFANRKPRVFVSRFLFLFFPARIFLTSSSSTRFPFEFSIKASSLQFIIERASFTLRVNIYAKFHKLQSHIHTEWSRVFIISERRTRGERERERETYFDIFRLQNIKGRGKPPAFISPLERSRELPHRSPLLPFISTFTSRKTISLETVGRPFRSITIDKKTAFIPGVRCALNPSPPTPSLNDATTGTKKDRNLKFFTKELSLFTFCQFQNSLCYTLKASLAYFKYTLN